MVVGSNTGGGEIFGARSCGPSTLLSNGYRVSFPGLKRPGRGVHHPPLFGGEGKERSSTYNPLWNFMANYRVSLAFFFVAGEEW